MVGLCLFSHNYATTLLFSLVSVRLSLAHARHNPRAGIHLVLGKFFLSADTFFALSPICQTPNSHS